MLARVIEELPRFFTYYNIVFLVKATATTLLLSACGCLLGFALGFLLAVLRLTRGRALMLVRGACISFVEFFRRVPFLVTLMGVFFFYQALNLDVSVFVVALTSVCLISTSYIAEIARSGFESVGAMQWETAEVMNFSLFQQLRLIILPQAWKVILPPAFSFFILFIKDTALASQIGVIELTYSAKVLNNKGFSAVLAFGTILILYFFISYPLARFGGSLEKKLGLSQHRKR